MMVADEHAALGPDEGDEQVGGRDLPGLVDDGQVELHLGQQRGSSGADTGSGHHVGVPDHLAAQFVAGIVHLCSPLGQQFRAPGRQRDGLTEVLRVPQPVGQLVRGAVGYRQDRLQAGPHHGRGTLRLSERALPFRYRSRQGRRQPGPLRVTGDSVIGPGP